MNVTIFIADDHAIVRDGLRYLLEAQEGFSVVGEADNGRDAVKKVRQVNPDIVLMDIAMSEMNGIEAAELICKQCPETRVIILSMYASSEHIMRALGAGVAGYILKESAGSELIDAVKSVRAGRRFMSRKVSDRIWDDKLAPGKTIDSGDPLKTLSLREREVLQLVAEGRTSAEIAQKLHLSPKTVDTYRSRLMQKLNVRDLPGLIKFCIQYGLITIEKV